MTDPPHHPRAASPGVGPDSDRGPRLPTPDEVADLNPAGDLFVALLDEISERTLGRPLRPRVQVSPAGLLRGEIDLVKIELPAYAVAGLVLDRFVIRARRVRVVPGIPPSLVAEPVELEAIVSQANLDRWTRSLRLPFRLELTPDGVLTTTGIGGIRVTEILTDLGVSGQFLQLRPRRAGVLGRSTPIVRFLRGYLPLPPLPRDAHLDHVEHRDGELRATFVIARFEQHLTPDVTGRLRKVLNIPLPGL